MAVKSTITITEKRKSKYMDQKHAPTLVKVWDIWLRLFHWTFAIAVIFLLLSGEFGWFFFEWHKLVGEVVVALVLFRCIWGFIGSSTGKLTSLITHPKHVIKHIIDLFKGSIHHDRGHSASGGWAVIVMLLLIGFQALSGLFIADEDELIEGVFYGMLSEDLSSQLLSLHYQNALFIQIIVVIHILTIIFYALRGGINLVKPMITGYIKWPANLPIPAAHFRANWVACVLLISVLGSLSWLFNWW